MTRRFGVRTLAAGVLAAWTAGASVAHAQALGSIFGKVTDASGGVLPGVTVTVTGTGLQQPLVATSSESGTYQFPSVPIGTYTVTFELSSFKKAVRQNVIITTGFNAGIDQKLEIGQISEEVTVSSASPVVDTKRTTTGAVFTSEILEKIPTARDPWQIVNMTPGVQLNGYNVGGSQSGQQLTPSVRGSSANVQWNLEGGSITDLSSNSSSIYYNFDSFDQIQVTTGGGDVSVQSSGLSINLVTKSGSNRFKGTFNTTFENESMQGQNVTEEQFNAGANGFLSGNPLHKIANYSIEAGGPILKDRLWYWGSMDRQDINVGVTNFFDPAKGTFCQDLIAAQKKSQLAGAITYDNLDQVQNCLSNDQTLIKDIQGKVNYQLNAANKFGYVFVSNDKIRNHRGASSTTQPESTTQQFGPAPAGLPYQTHQLQYTWIANDRLVFNTSGTHVSGAFFLDYQDHSNCGDSAYLPGETDPSKYATGARASADCLWNIQALSNRTTSVSSRSLRASYQTVRPTWDIKTDGTYFLTHALGGDHSLKFGLGYRKAPIMSFSHYSGGAQPVVQCVGNTLAGCGDGNYAAGGSASGIVPFSAVVYRDQLLNNDWWSYNGYLQDGYSRGRWRVNGGLRYDWQQSKYLGGCVPANVIVPDLLPAQCEDATMTDATNGRKIQSFGNWSPRVSVTRDLFGNGKTQVHGNVAYYHDTKITLANSLGGLATRTTLTWGNNQSNGLCNTAAGGSCWTDANRDGLIQRSELIGTPTASSTRYDINTGILAPAGNIVDPSANIGRTREGVVGVQHELIANLAIGVDYIYRKYDRGTTTYTIGYQPGGPLGSLSAIYVPASGGYTDPVTGINAPYYVVCQGCARPSGVGNITVTNPDYQIYQGVDFTATKRYSNKWQLQAALTIQTNPSYFPEQSASFIDPTGREFRDGASTIPRWNLKMNGSYTLPWDIAASANFNAIEGASRTTTITGPGAVYGGVNSTGGATTINKNTLEFEDRGSTRAGSVSLLDLGVQKNIRFAAGRSVRLMFDAFNVMNVNTITTYSSGNRSLAGFTQPTAIIAPRVFRVGARLAF
jgi:Carboxypeptidase regulatory-like domain